MEEKAEEEKKNLFLLDDDELKEQISVCVEKIATYALNLEQARIHLMQLIAVKGIRESKKGGLID